MQSCASSRIVLSALLPGALLILVMGTARAVVSDPATAARWFGQAEKEKLTDHSRFVDALKQLHQQASQFSPTQRWHLLYLEAWRAAYAGELTQAAHMLHNIIDNSGDAALVNRASALLINVLSRDHQYEEAYKLANALTVGLPKITDPDVRGETLRAIIQMLGLAGQPDQAEIYVRQLGAEPVTMASRCANYSYEVSAQDSAGKLSSNSLELHRAISTCLGDKQMVYANTLRLDMAWLLVDEGHADLAIRLLERIAPSIRSSRFQPHIALLHASLARAYLRQGNDAQATKSALAALAVSDPMSFTEPLQAAYEVLYNVEKSNGHPAAALGYYEKFVAQDKAAMDDTKTRALAYQMVRQEVLDKKLKLEALDKRNRILELRQELAGKAQETSRLYIVLLALVIVVIGLWTFRLKHSQLRFRQMARHDGLTGVFNRQHFLHEAARILQRLHLADAGACLVALDLDHFKRINDTYGHAAGDEALRRVVEICRGELRDSDLFGRLGGEEFGILMPACTCEQGIEIATRIRRSLATALLKLDPETTVVVSASLGLAHSAVSGYAFHQLFTDADAALYRAKHGGRNQLVVDTGGDAPVVADADMPDTANA